MRDIWSELRDPIDYCVAGHPSEYCQVNSNVFAFRVSRVGSASMFRSRRSGSSILQLCTNGFLGQLRASDREINPKYKNKRE